MDTGWGKGICWRRGTRGGEFVSLVWPRASKCAESSRAVAWTYITGRENTGPSSHHSVAFPPTVVPFAASSLLSTELVSLAFTLPLSTWLVSSTLLFSSFDICYWLLPNQICEKSFICKLANAVIKLVQSSGKLSLTVSDAHTFCLAYTAMQIHCSWSRVQRISLLTSLCFITASLHVDSFTILAKFISTQNMELTQGMSQHFFVFHSSSVFFPPVRLLTTAAATPALFLL